jgi:hypothetical protein
MAQYISGINNMKKKSIQTVPDRDCTNTVSSYLLERKIKRLLKSAGYEGEERITIEMKVERLEQDMLELVFDLLNEGEVYKAIDKMGLIYNVCTCDHHDFTINCSTMRYVCTCCIKCQRNCKR